jgi:ABC-2 type transport system permease protein
MGTGTAAVGIVFAAVAVVTAQLASFGRSANAMASSVLAVAYLLRAVGDGNGSLSWLSWMSPLSWATHLRAFAHERWWPLLLALAAVVGLLVAAGVLLRRRDVGSGVLEPADGAARAPARLSTSWALAWRLQRTSLFVWTIGVAVFGAALGSLAGSVADVMGDNADVTQIVRDMGGSSMLTDAFAALTVGMFGLIAAGYAVQAMLHARAEEAQGRAEPVLATGTTRLRWMSGHLVQSLAGSAVIVLVAGLTIGAAAGAASDVSPPRVLEGAALQLPAVWVFAGLACLLVGLLPRAVAVAWAAVGLAVGLWFFGPLLGLDEAVLDVSPFQHVPQVPGGEVTVAPLLALSCIAVALITAGLVGFRRRDVA